MRRLLSKMQFKPAIAAFAAMCAAVALGTAAFELALRLSPIDPAPYLAVEASPVLLDRADRLLHARLNASDAWSFPKDASEHAPYLRLAAIAAEDQRFERHSGVDPVAIARAALQNAAERRVASGASTITMQVVKLSDAQARSLSGKLAQAWNAIRLERAASKDAILTAYLNRAPFGYNLIGAEAAARRFFGKSSSELTLNEAALLAGLPKAPGKLDPLRNPESAKLRRDYVLGRMRDERFISDAQYQDALAAPLGAAWCELPMDAPHLAAIVKAQTVTRTTIDGPRQHAVQALLANYIKQYDGTITNAAAVIIDVDAAEFLAYCGSADFLRSDGGQMDLVRAVRSPGSALKPFVYGIAMQNNRLYPSEMLLDDTLDYGDYRPANYDGEFNGMLPADEALRYSLNVPAVQVLDRVGVGAAHEILRSLGISTLDRAPSHYGLGLALGNCGIRLDELAGAYRAVAAMGVYEPIRFVRDAASGQPKRVLNDDIAAALYDMLRQPLPKELPDSLVQSSGGRTPVAWKTGTSTGHHDAWAFVFNRHYVVGVWLGNADGRTSNRLVGAETALPLAELIFRGLPEKESPAWPDAASTSQFTRVCSATGLPKSASCEQSRAVPLPKSAFLNRRCDVHREALAQATPLERWPSSARRWDLASVQNPVPLNAAQGAVRAALKITSPADNSEYVLTGKAGADRIRLSASLEYDQAVHWYADGQYLGASRALSPVFLNLESGEHEIACMVESGATDSAKIVVVEPERDRMDALEFRPR